jgi:UDP-glucose 4-epimerase
VTGRRVLVTGGSGWIGGAACRTLAEHGDVPVVFDGGLDVRHRHVVDTQMATCDAVIHLAGVLGSAETFGAEYQAAEVNVLGAINVLDAAAQCDIPMVLIGTGHRGQLNPYAVTKACAEDLALGRAVELGQKVAVVRAFHAYGPGQKMCPPHGTAKVRKIVPSMVCRALSGMPVEVFGDGRQLVDMVHVDDVAAVLVDALEGPFDGVVVEAGTGVATPVSTVARDVLLECGRGLEAPVFLPRRRGEPERAVVVARTPAVPRDHAWPYRLDETVAWYREALARG